MMQMTSLRHSDDDRTSWRNKVLHALNRNIKGMTSSEIMIYYNVKDPNKIRPRLTDMKLEGLVHIAGERNGEIVWRR